MDGPGKPVAAVVVDTPLAHLDREFEYAVPPELDETARPGVRVRVRFAGRDLAGFVVARRERPSHPGALAPLRTVVSPEPVLTEPLLRLCRAVAHRYAGTTADVLRLAVPARHATAEKALTARPPVDPGPPEHPAGDLGPWHAYPAGPPFLHRVAAGEAPAASWTALPGQPAERDWPVALAVAAAWALHAGRGVLIVVPDHRDVERVDGALRRVLGPGRHVRLTADQGPQARYTAWLSVLRGHARCVVGTRAAAFAPVHDLGLVAWWDDGDDVLDEPRAPYPQAGQVLRIRAAHEGAALLVGGFARSVRQELALADGVDRPVAADPATVRAAAPRVLVAGEDDERSDAAAATAHLPSLAWRTAAAALGQGGSVLVQVPRRGYIPSVRCQDCREPVRCPRCHGPMTIPGPRAGASCRWCGAGWGAAGFTCPNCGGHRLRSSVVGARRTAEELGRAFPGARVITSGAGEVVASVTGNGELVVATPGAEPVPEHGYAAVLLLDAWALLDRSTLDAGVEAFRRWGAAAALARPGRDGGRVVVCGVPTGTVVPAVEALVRWDPGWLAGRELTERGLLRLPPTVVLGQVVGPRPVVAAIAGTLTVDDPELELLGPIPVARTGGPDGAEPVEGVQLLVRVPRAQAGRLAEQLAAVRAVRSARKAAERVLVRMDVSDVM